MLNTVISNVPGVYVNIIPPVPVLNGVPTNLIAFIGTAVYGPKNSPTVFGNIQEAVSIFGNPQPFQYDLITAAAIASVNGAANFLGVRVTDGTDTDAAVDVVDSLMVPVTGATLTSIYTGSGANNIFATMGVGSGSTPSAPTYKCTIYMQGGIPEVYDAIGGTGATFWQNLVNAINLGQSSARGKSRLVTAAVGTSTATPLLTTTPYQLSGGTDGNTTITTATLIGDDSASPRTGMYSLRNSSSNMIVLVDADDPTYYTTQASFGSQEGAYMIGVMTAGYQDDIAGAITIKQSAGIDSSYFKLMYGDWIEINDTFNNQTRFVSPGAFVAAILATTDPDESALNVQMSAIVSTQKTAENRIYSDADLSQIGTANMDLVTKPIPASTSAYGCRFGINTSSNLLASTDAYTRMNNYIALTVLSAMGEFIGKPLSNTVVSQILDTINAYLQTLQQKGWIGVLTQTPNQAPPSAFSVTLDQTQVNVGILVANVNVSLWSILTQLVINLNANSGQQTVQTLPPQLI